MNPHGDSQTISCGCVERNDLGCRGSGGIAKVQVVVHLNGCKFKQDIQLGIRSSRQSSANPLLTLSAVISGKIEGTLTIETLRQIYTRSPWGTGIILAVHYVLLTVLACKSGWTNASIAGSVVDTRGSILTSIRLTGIVLVLAANATIIRGAGTVKA